MMTTPETIRQIADAALAHVRSVERRMLGLPVRGRVADRIDAELAKRGLTVHHPSEAPR